jgi:hypothetical protein
MAGPFPMTQAVRRQLLLLCVIGMAFAAPILWQFFRPGDALLDISGHQYGRDFLNMWAGPRIAAQSGIMALFDYEAYYKALQSLYGAPVPFHNWGYPPHLFFFISPFSALPYIPGLILWTMLGFTLYAGVVLTQLPAAARRAGLVFLLLAPASIVNAVTGQNGFFTATLFLGGLMLLDRRPVLAGVMFGLLTVKPQLGLLLALALVAIGAWRCIVATTLTASLLAATSILLWGVDPWIGWLTQAGRYQQWLLTNNFDGFYTYMMPSVFAAARLVGLPAEIAGAIQAMVAAPVVVVTLFAFRRTHDTAARALLLACGTLLVSPYAFNYDMTLLTAALLWTLTPMATVGDRDRQILGAAWLLPTAIMPLHIVGFPPAPFVLGALFVLVASRILRPQPQTTLALEPSLRAT